MTIGTTSTLQFPRYTLLKPSYMFQLLTRGEEKRQETGIQMIITIIIVIIIIIIIIIIIMIIFVAIVIIIKIYTSAYEHTVINTII